MQNKERNPLAKAFGMLRWMIDQNIERVGVRTAASELGMTPSSAHRIITALVEEGMLEKEVDTGRYVLGLEMIRLAHQVVDRWSLSTVAKGPMGDLVTASGEAAFLNLYDHGKGEIIGVESVESNQVLRYVVELNKWKPVYVGAAGWAVMAYLDENDRDAIIRRSGLKPITDRSLTDADELAGELERVRSQGYAITRGQRIPGAVGLAAPLFGPSGRVLGSVGLSLPEQRFSVGNEPHLAALLKKCADDIMSAIGSRAANAAMPEARNDVDSPIQETARQAELRP